MSTRRRSKRRVQINVTSLVDIAFTLLLVFIIVTPVLTAGVDLELPETHAQAGELAEDRIDIAIDASGALHFAETEYGSAGDLLLAILEHTEGGIHHAVYLQADRRSPYAPVAEVLGALQGSGFSSLTLVTRARD